MLFGAAAAYEQIEDIDPNKVKDLLKVHKPMMDGLVEGAGTFRRRQVGVMDGAGNVVHMAPPPASPRHIPSQPARRNAS